MVSPDASADAPRIGLVLGAGGPAGGAWTRGCFAALEVATGFQPAMATELVGTSVGAFIAGRIGPPMNATSPIRDALVELASVPGGPSALDRFGTVVRSTIGRAICAAQPPGRDDPVSWVEHIEPESIARVVSARCRRGVRRVRSLEGSAHPDREIAASGAVPIGAKPVAIDGAQHIDGAVLSVTNADLVDPGSVDVLIVIAPLVSTGPGGSLLSRAGRRQLRCELRPASRTGTPTIVLAPPGAEYERRQERERHQAVAAAVFDAPRASW